jgi:hypothetical protein
MDHRTFLEALRSLVDHVAIVDGALTDALPQQLRDVTRLDPLTVAAGGEFGRPLVRWFRFDSPVSGAALADGTVVLDVTGRNGPVWFLHGITAEHAAELPDGWRETARQVATVTDGRVVIA